MRSGRLIGTPEPGYFKRRLVKLGPWVSVRFFLDDGEIRVEVDGRLHDDDGKAFDPYEEWPLCWPSTEADYRFFAVMREWAQRHAPHHPAANPRRRIRLDDMPPRRRP
jgi:hypothetical protein